MGTGCCTHGPAAAAPDLAVEAQGHGLVLQRHEEGAAVQLVLQVEHDGVDWGAEGGSGGRRGPSTGRGASAAPQGPSGSHQPHPTRHKATNGLPQTPNPSQGGLLPGGWTPNPSQGGLLPEGWTPNPSQWGAAAWSLDPKSHPGGAAWRLDPKSLPGGAAAWRLSRPPCRGPAGLTKPQLCPALTLTQVGVPALDGFAEGQLAPLHLQQQRDLLPGARLILQQLRAAEGSSARGHHA